jgi:hypothetical protein
MMRMRQRIVIALAIVAGLGGCGGAQDPAPLTPASAVAEYEHGDVVLPLGDVTIRASVVQTSALPQSVARQYDIERSPETLLLLVGARKGPPASAVAIPVRVTARVTDLRGDQQRIAMREVREGDSIDSAGMVRTSLPETLRFDLSVAIAGQPPVKMQFVRDFYPQ